MTDTATEHRADVEEALAHLNHEAKRIPAHWLDDRAHIYRLINDRLTEWESTLQDCD